MILAVFLSVCLTGVVQLMAEEIWTACVITGHREGPGNLTCKFGVDLRMSKKPFAVQRYGLDSYNTEPDDVLLGAWYDRDTMDYYVRDGYAFDSQVSNTIVIKMSSITPDYEGRYRCHVIPPDEELVDECVLKMSDLPPPPSTSPRSMDRTTKGNQEDQASSSPGMFAGALVRWLPIAAMTAVVTRLLVKSER